MLFSARIEPGSTASLVHCVQNGWHAVVLTRPLFVNPNFYFTGGKWAEWSEYSCCSVSCGGGLQIRSRHCIVSENGKLFPPCMPTNEHPTENEWSFAPTTHLIFLSHIFYWQIFAFQHFYHILCRSNLACCVFWPAFRCCLLCISTIKCNHTFAAHTESWLKYFFAPFSTFFVEFNFSYFLVT